MHVHEYQAKKILREYDIPISDFEIVTTVEETLPALKKLNLFSAVSKVQIHAGGRGKAGGIKIGKSQKDVVEHVKALLGLQIINNQTGTEGIVVKQVMITEPVNFQKEYYVGVTIDRHNAKAVLIISPAGGVDIEEVAAKTPDLIKKISLNANGALYNYQFLEITKFMGWKNDLAEQGKKIIKNLIQVFIKTDALLLEINPLVLTNEGVLLALDAKLTVDDDALFRQPELASWYDPTQLMASEARAHEFDLAYIALEGNIGCMVNGAGLAMATMDIIQYYGGKPANFLDVGGGASEEKIAEGFKIILSDPKVKVILVNIFGGIMNCLTLAGGIIAATKELHVNVPLIIRMEGTNVEQGKQLLAKSGLNIIIANDLADAASKAVKAGS